MIKIVVDLQGADRCAGELVEGVVKSLKECEELTVYACGDKREMLAHLQDLSYPADRFIAIDAPETVSGSDDPMGFLRTKPNSSLVKGMKLCNGDPEIRAFVSCGSTGALFVAAMMNLKRTSRTSPMLLCELKKRDGSPFCIVDCGANVDCRPEKLVDFARMGSVYMRTNGISEPKIALLSNGAEDLKGNATVKKANSLLRQSGLNFIGNVEGNHVLDGEADVIVCEGFAGNILLKTIEGSAKAVIDELETLVLAHSQNEWVLEATREAYNKYDYNSKGGAVLLGVDIPIVKGHGAADADTLYHIINLAVRLSKNRIIEKIQKEYAAT